MFNHKMNMKISIIILVLINLSLSQEWRISEHGYIKAFPKGLTSQKGKLINCEASTIVFDGKNIILGNDKDIPSDTNIERSAIFFIKFNSFKKNQVKYFKNDIFKNARKYEDFTITPDGVYILATTGFDRSNPNNPSKTDMYNTVLFWPVAEPEKVSIVTPIQRNGITSSIGLRGNILSVLNKNKNQGLIKYIKIEGLAAIPGKKLLFGIREYGQSYKKFTYTIKIISVSYQIIKGEILLADDFQLIYDFTPTGFGKKLNYETIALSSIEYNKYDDALLLLTSYEKEINGKIIDESIGAFLWNLPIKSLEKGLKPKLLYFNEKPIHFSHKAEGITIISKNKIMIIHDDDRVTGRAFITNPDTQFSRKRNQACYTILER